MIKKSILLIVLIVIFIFIYKVSVSNSVDNAINFKYPADFESAYTFLFTQNYNYGDVTRKRITIAVSEGLNKADVEYNIKKAIQNHLSKNKTVNALSIFVVRNSDENYFSTYTIARGTFAPNGRWEDAKNFTSYSQNKLVIDYRDNYFTKKKNPKKELNAGQTIIIKKGTTISSSPGDWTDDETILKLSDNIKAIIVEKKLLPIGEFDIIRYKIKLNINNNEILGWIHSYNIKLL